MCVAIFTMILVFADQVSPQARSSPRNGSKTRLRLAITWSMIPLFIFVGYFHFGARSFTSTSELRPGAHPKFMS